MTVATKNTVVQSAQKDKIYRILLNNRRIKDGYQYTIPSPDTYPYQWLWDSCFHAIILSHLNTEEAKAELRSLVSAQFTNGMLPHMIYWQRQRNPDFQFLEINWGKRHTSSITQPPMLAYAVWSIYRQDHDKAFLLEMYPHIQRFHSYLFRHRDPRHNNLVGVVNPDESGEDNSPRFDEALGLDPQHEFSQNFSNRLKLVEDYRKARFVIKDRMDVHHWVRDVPFNAILAASLDLSGSIADALGKTEEATKDHIKARKVRHAMRTHMLSDNLFWSTLGLDYKLIKIKTWALFMPLFARVATPEEAKLLVNHYLFNKQEFGTPFGVPTVSVAEPSFNADGDWRGSWWVGTNWRGPVWSASNWFIVKGLQQYGFKEEAQRIIDDTQRLIGESGFREYYDPFTGEGHGARDFTWGGLLIDMQE